MVEIVKVMLDGTNSASPMDFKLVILDRIVTRMLCIINRWKWVSMLNMQKEWVSMVK